MIKKHDIHCPDNPLNVCSACIVKVNNKFFLLIEIDSHVRNVDIEPIFAVKISESDASRLIHCGIKCCKVTVKKPRKSRFRCILILDNKAFRVYENCKVKDEFILVESEICKVVEDNC